MPLSLLPARLLPCLPLLPLLSLQACRRLLLSCRVPCPTRLLDAGRDLSTRRCRRRLLLLRLLHQEAARQ